MFRRSISFMLAGAMAGVSGGLYLDLALAGVAGGRWTIVHIMLIFTGGLGGLWLWDELGPGTPPIRRLGCPAVAPEPAVATADMAKRLMVI
jgi:hypothetical protein